MIKSKPSAAPRRYTVTVTPDVVLYGTGSAGREYTVTVLASSRDEAIRRERRVRQLEDGGSGVRFTYRARLADQDADDDTRIDGFNPEFLGAKPARQGEDY